MTRTSSALSPSPVRRAAPRVTVLGSAALLALALGACNPKQTAAPTPPVPEVGFVNAYGLTETSSTIAVLGPEDHRAAHGHPGRYRAVRQLHR